MDEAKAQKPSERYFRDFYGHCSLGAKCRCLQESVWLGEACPEWQPIAASLDELMAYAKRSRLNRA